jgi:hypothetical protein
MHGESDGTLVKPKRLGYDMATAHREDGFELRIWPNDHTPPHVHACKAGGMAKIELVDGFDVVKVRKMKPLDVVRAVRIVMANEEKLIRAWEEIHGY